MYDWQVIACAKDFKITDDFSNGKTPLISKIVLFIKAKSAEEAAQKIQEWFTIESLFIYEIKRAV